MGVAPEMLKPGEIEGSPGISHPPFPPEKLPLQREDPPKAHPNVRECKANRTLYGLANKGIDLNAPDRLPY